MRAWVSVFLSSALVTGTMSAQDPPRDQPPAYVEAARQEAQLKARIAAEGLTPQHALSLAALQEKRGAAAEAEATLLDARKLFPADRTLISSLARYYTLHGKGLEAVDVLEQLARLEPGDRLAHYTIATYYEEMIRKGQLSPDDKRALVLRGIAAVDRALALDAEYSDALVYKNILLRHQALMETDPAQQKRLLVEADGLRAQAIELRKQQGPNASLAGTLHTPAPPPPPPPPPGSPRPPCAPASSLLAQAPVRVGGNIKAPAKVRDVRPVYPDVAQSARIQGVVIIEATIAEDGRVVGACVLRSIPLLDEAAVEAVNQWEFTPTMLNGVAVPVVMTVTVNFTLQ
jgi:TonB family protein